MPIRHAILPALVLLAVSCSPTEVAEGSADLRRCNEMADDGIEIGFLMELAERAGIPSDAVAGFLTSDTYTRNAKAWDWALCLGAYGWECVGSEGVGTTNVTPPSSCRSPGDTNRLTAENPHL